MARVRIFLDIAVLNTPEDVLRVIENQFLESTFTDKEKAIIGAALGQMKEEYLLGDRRTMYGFLAFLTGV